MTDTTTCMITVRGIEPINKGRLVGLAVVDVEIDGVAMTIQGLQVRRKPDGTYACSAPCYRHTDGTWAPAVVLPPELAEAIAAEVFAFQG